jgi:Tol biopolymer transport system component
VWPGSASSGQATPGLSGPGTLLYQPFPADRRVVRESRDGAARMVDAEWSGLFDQWGLSPDGNRLAVTVERDGCQEIGVRSLVIGTFTRLAFEGTYNYRPFWTRDGRSLVFVSDRSGHAAIYQAPADGSGAATLVRDDPVAVDEGVYSRDGRWLLNRTASGGGCDSYAIRPGVDSAPVAVATSPFEEYAPALAPVVTAAADGLRGWSR